MTIVLPKFVTEVKADETPAVQAVLKADTKRLALLEEAKKLEEAGKDTDRLKEVLLFKR